MELFFWSLEFSLELKRNLDKSAIFGNESEEVEQFGVLCDF